MHSLIAVPVSPGSKISAHQHRGSGILSARCKPLEGDFPVFKGDVSVVTHRGHAPLNEKVLGCTAAVQGVAEHHGASELGLVAFNHL